MSSPAAAAEASSPTSTTTITTAAASDERSRPRMSAKKLGSYMLIKSMKLGTGSFAEVYKGYHRTTQQPVAIKVISRSKLSDKLLSSLEFEISILRKLLDHEHIVKLFAVHVWEDPLTHSLTLPHGTDSWN